MKFSRKALLVASAVVVAAVGLRADLTRWAENIDATSRLEAVFFRNVLLPSGQVPVRRPPKETRAALSRLITTAPNDAELYSLRALEAEQQLDFAAAEADWKRHIDVAADKGAARLALADYYHRRHQPQQEFDALTLAARELAPASERLLAETQQRPWRTYERLTRLIDEQRLDPTLGIAQYGAWMQRFPQQPAVYTGWFNYALAHNFYPEAEQAVAAYLVAFPNDAVFPVAARAEAAAKRGQTADALALFERSYQPLWPETLVKRYFDLLRQTNGLRAYLDRARAAIAANPTDLAAATRLFHYWDQQNDTNAARRALAEFRQRKQARQPAWTADELLTLAKLSEAQRDYDEAARNYYALYGLNGSEAALEGLARLLLTAPEMPIQFGSGNLSLYRDVATMDPHPGFLNGVLSLLLNETDPPNRHAFQKRNADAYFRRAQAAELVALFESRFPNSAARAGLRELVIETYAIYGDSAGVIRTGARFLTDFPNATNRTAVALRMADAYARTNQTQPEFAQYDAVLAELARRADGVPLGALAAPPTQPNAQAPATVRSPEYARVLTRYVARLVSLRRTNDALGLYRREIDRNPNDPGLYDLLAAFLEQNKLGGEIEQVYQRAIAQFQEPTWRHKLARWYLRQRRQADTARLTRDVIRIFAGTDLESYFREIVTQAAPVGPALYLQLNLAAHQRFPHQLSFARNLLTAYTTRGTADDLAYEAVLRQHWYHADDLRMRFFERLSRQGRLAAELAIVRTANPAATASRWQEAVDQSPATVRMLAEGDLWRGHYETAAPMLQILAASYPADRALGQRTAAVFRSLGAFDAAVGVGTNLSQADPLDHSALTRIGEMQADRGRFEQAREAWDKIPEIDPAKPEGYLETATIFWDYYRYDEALRWIDTSRTRLAQPALYAYQAGAIHENRRDYDRAMREYARGAIAQTGGGGLAERRLLALARRATLRQPIDQLTDNLVSARNPQPGAFNLRVALLKNQNRRDDLERFLEAVTARTDSPNTLATTGNTARIEGFPRVEQSALERRIALSTDPVERMNLRLTLARLHESQARGTEGAQVIDALYRDNPAILGVVRAAVDYHWRNRNRRRAVDVLEEAAGRAAPGYRTQFALEAARKATEAGDYVRARGFATTLLASDPFRADFVAVMADTYARERNDQGLRAFYTAKIVDLAKSALAAAERVERTAAMRRALIPVLARTRDFTAAVDQYMEIVNRYPEDEALVREVTQFARANSVASRLRDYYAKASSDSPKDFRWPMVLGRIETHLEDYPAAIAAYTRAAGVRPDRADLLEARLHLEERLLRLDEAAATSEKLYELTYRNSRWMDKLAEIRARQGRATDAVTALNRAWIEGRPDHPINYFTAAQKLESWGLLVEARTITQEGLRRVPQGEASNAGELLMARLATRLRDTNAVFARLNTLPGALAVQVATQMGASIAAYYTPDEKAAFASGLATRPRRMEIARAAGFADLEGQWLYAAMMAAPNSNQGRQSKEQLVQLQTQRTRFAELGQQLEAYERALPAGAPRSNELEQAAEAFYAAGDAVGELRVLQRAHTRTLLSGKMFERYAALTLAQPGLLNTTLAQEPNAEAAYKLLNYVFQHASGAVAQQAVAARTARDGALWTKAYTGLAGLHFSTNTAAVRTAFTDILGDMTIGARIGRPVDRNVRLAGDLWFYYGGRFGEYLGITRQTGAEDYLPAMLEGTAARSEAYFTLAEYFAGAGDAASAAQDYRNALELNPSRADVHDRLAVLAAKAGRTDEAVAEWKLAFQAFTDAMNRSSLPARFWGDVNTALVHIGEAKLAGPLRDDADRLLRLYIRRNGGFQVDPLLIGAMAFAGDTTAGVTWITDLAGSAADPAQFLGALLDRDWIPDTQRGMLHQRIVESARARTTLVFGEARIDAESQVWNAQIAFAEYLVNRSDNARARQVLDELPEQIRRERAAQLVPLEIRLAARAGQLATRLAALEEPIRLDALRNAASELRGDGDPAGARRVLEFVYQHELNAGGLDAANFLGLAEIRLEEGDTPGALALLRRMTLVSGEAFLTLDPAAGLLERTGRTNEAIEFLNSLTRAEPWNADARRRLAEAQRTPATLGEVARSSAAPYAIRVAAARAIRRLNAAALTGVDAELDALSSQSAGVQIANPYAYEARVEAAARGTAAQQIDQLQAVLAMNPTPQGARLRLFYAAIGARRDALASVIGRQLLPPYFRDEGGRGFAPWMADGFLAQFALADRIGVARGLAEASERLGDLRDAALFFQVARVLAPQQPAIEQSLIAVRSQLELRARNDARRPMAGKELEQDRLVRPRLTQ